jgi:hypothetical protein
MAFRSGTHHSRISHGQAHESANQRVNSALLMLAAWVSVTTIIIMEIEFDAAKNQRKANNSIQ